MKRNHQRERQFSATRLSYSRNNSYKNSQPSVSPSRVANPQPKDRSLTLMCNNCFNKQVSVEKTHKNVLNNSNNGGTEWGLFRNDKSNIQNIQNEVKKTTEYNLLKIKENQQLKQQLKNQKHNEMSNSCYFGEKNHSTTQMNEGKRLELKRELEKQIAIARERREQQKRQIRDASPNFIIETEYSRNKREMNGQQYKLSLLEQMDYNRNKRLRDQELQKKQLGSYELPFVKDAEQKMQLLLKAKNATKQSIREQFRKKKEQQQNLRQQYNKEREAEQRYRLESEKYLREEHQKAQQMRRNAINGYLQDLRKQMQENQVRRQKQFEKINNEPSQTLIPVQNHNTVASEPCGCCSKEFPKNFLSPCVRPTQTNND